MNCITDVIVLASLEAGCCCNTQIKVLKYQPKLYNSSLTGDIARYRKIDLTKIDRKNDLTKIDNLVILDTCRFGTSLIFFLQF